VRSTDFNAFLCDSRAHRGAIPLLAQSTSIASLFGEAISALDGLVKDAIETLDESGWVFEWDALEKKGLVEE
jgi:hypothetical protein